MKGIERKRKLYPTSADECRDRGIKVGDRLIGDEGYGPTVIEITAIGRNSILAEQLSQNGNPCHSYEALWTLECRDWEVV